MFIGVNFAVCTMRHYIEATFVEQALAVAHPQRRAKLRSQLRGWRKPGKWPDHNSVAMEAIYRKRGLMNYSKIGSATVRHVKAHEMVDAALEVFQAEPELWFKPYFMEWYREATE